MGKFTAFKLPLKSLDRGSHEFDYRLDKQFFTDMENVDIRDADLSVKLDVVYNGDVYDLDFAITGNIVLVCDRCLDDLDFPVDAGYHIMVKYGDDYNDESDTMLEIPNSDNYLNVAYMIYDTVALAIPIKHVHPLGKCNRAMSAILKKHRARPGDTDSELENELIDEIDEIGTADDTAGAVSDPRWDALKGLASDDND